MGHSIYTIATQIEGDIVYVSKVVPQRDSSNVIPCYTSKPEQAMDFLGPNAVQRFFNTVVNYPGREFRPRWVNIPDK